MLFTVYSSTYRDPDSEELRAEYPQLANYGHSDGSIVINSLEELMQLSKDVGCALIIGGDRDPSKPQIELYDGYRE